MRISKWVKIICALLNYFYVALFRTSYLLQFHLEFRLYAAVNETLKKNVFHGKIYFRLLEDGIILYLVYSGTISMLC